MKFITVTELKQNATQVVSDIECSLEKVVVTKKGKPAVIMFPFSQFKESIMLAEETIRIVGEIRERAEAALVKAQQKEKKEGKRGKAKGQKSSQGNP